MSAPSAAAAARPQLCCALVMSLSTAGSASSSDGVYASTSLRGIEQTKNMHARNSKGFPLLPDGAPERSEAWTSLLTTLVRNAQARHAERDAWLSDKHKDGPTFRTMRATGPIWSMFSPTFPCLWSLEKKPSSSIVSDGGKWLCGVHELGVAATRPPRANQRDGGCVVYSFGSFDKYHFEMRVHELAPSCAIHVFDPTVETPTHEKKAPGAVTAFHRVGLAGEPGLLEYTSVLAKDGGRVKHNGTLQTLEHHMAQLGHTYLDVLKIDIEGSEWKMLEKVDWHALRIGVLLFEAHPIALRGRAGDIHRLWSRLESAGLYQYAIEPVEHHDYSAQEVAFIHKDWTPGGWLR